MVSVGVREGFGVLFQLVVEGCAVASVLGVLEEREAAARVRVEDLREEAARVALMVEAAEIELDRRVIAREELVEALAAGAVEGPAAPLAMETVSSLAPVPGSPVPAWRDGVPVSVLARDYQRILGVLEERRERGQESLRARGITVALGLETTPAKIEGVRVKARRLGKRGWLLVEASGAFSAVRRPVAVPDGGSSG